MTAILRKSGNRAILIHSCDECGSDNAPFGFRRAAQPSRWYCAPHRDIGESWLRGEG